MAESLFAGYTIVEKLGHGAGSTLYVALEAATRRRFVVKRILRKRPTDDRFIIQAENEYQVTHHFDHPYLRRTVGIRRSRKWLKTLELQLLMDYTAGHTLEEERPTDVGRVVEIFRMVAEGLAELHRLGYVHADLKPNNIMVDGPDRLKIIDFGQSCPMGYAKERIQGTPDYMAPEQVRRGVLDQRTDVFGFGATLYWVLTERAVPTLMPSKKRPTGIDLAGPTEIEPPERVNPAIPPVLSRLVQDCVSADPERRPTDCRQVLSRLEMTRLVMQRSAQGPASPTDPPDVPTEPTPADETEPID
jgi:serine/threonine-protein kinase